MEFYRSWLESVVLAGEVCPEEIRSILEHLYAEAWTDWAAAE